MREFPMLKMHIRRRGTDSRLRLFASTWPQGRILLVGEGDFSYSADLCSQPCASRHVIATTMDSNETLPRLFPRALDHVAIVVNHGGHVIYGVDATSLSTHPLIQGPFDVVRWREREREKAWFDLVDR